MPTRVQDASPIPRRLLTGHFRNKQGYSTYRANGTRDWLLIYTINGIGRFQYGTDRLICQAGDIVLLQPQTLHDYAIAPGAKRWDILWAHFDPRPGWMPWLDWPSVSERYKGLLHLSLVNRPTRKRVEAALNRMHRSSALSRRAGQELAINALEEALLWCDAQNNSHITTADPRVQAAQDFLCHHIHKTLRLSDVAEEVGLSISRLSEIFHRQIGLTLQQFHEQQKLERARQLLELTDFSIKQIAAEVGFDNPFYFTLRFKKHTGVNPTAYRKQPMNPHYPNTVIQQP